MLINPLEVEIRVESDLAGARATWQGHRVGHLISVPFDESARLLSDIVVPEKLEISTGLLARLIRKFIPDWRIATPKRIGIGSMLLQQFLVACEAAGVEEVFGNVPVKSLAEQPFLLDWYEKHGFRRSPPDGRAEFFPVASKVIWKRCAS